MRLCKLISQGHLPKGDVDTRSIAEVQPADVKGYTQCHFFAGIGGWALAATNVPYPIWTGSPPCQPYSKGNKNGYDKERDLWHEFYRLIRVCRPDRVFGEQVPTAIKQGWLDRVQTELEAEDYAVGACVLGAHSIGAPHIRQRLFWVGHSLRPRLQGHGASHPAPGPLRATAQTDCASTTAANHLPWSDYTVINGRRCKPGASLLVDGIPGRLVSLKTLGNAVIPQLARVFIEESEQAAKILLDKTPEK